MEELGNFDIKLTLDNDVDEDTCIIIDEADEWLKLNVFHLPANELHGAYLLKNAGKVFMLTATKTDFMTQITGVLTDDKLDDYLFEFPSKAEMSDGKSI